MRLRPNADVPPSLWPQQLLHMAAQPQHRRLVHVQLFGRGLGHDRLLDLLGQLGQHVALEPAQQEWPQLGSELFGVRGPGHAGA